MERTPGWQTIELKMTLEEPDRLSWQWHNGFDSG